MAVMVFDIETVPDIVTCRRLLTLEEGIEDQAVYAAMIAKRQAEGKSDFLPLHLQKIVAISVVIRQHDWFKVWSLGEVNSLESELIQRFYSGIAKYQPILVSWNGSGFDLPVLHYRALANKVVANQYWETGQTDQGFKWNNYINRYHERHLDLMDVLAGYQARSNAPLDEICTLLDLPGKMGESGGQVFERYLNHEIKGIRDYCETDVLNTYLVYLYFEYMRGHLTEDQIIFEYNMARQYLEHSNEPHLLQYAARMGTIKL